MSKPKVFVAITAVALVMPLTATGQKGKPTNPPAYTPCVIEQEVNSNEATVQVGRNTATYGPVDQPLYIHGSLLPPAGTPDPTGGIALVKGAPYSGGFYGPYYGQIRVLDNRIDYYFDTAMGCAQPDAAPNLCPFRLIVVDGAAVYQRVGKTRALVGISFTDGRTLFDYRTCNPANDPACYVKLYGCYDDRDCPGVPPGGNGYVYTNVYVRFE